MFKITSTEFIISAAAERQFPSENLPEIAFVGRSNVGKSSLLNTLVGRKGIAKVSATPGKTRQINFFRVNERFMFADLPGYGFAKVSQTERDAWARLAERYMESRQDLRLVVALSDIRHSPTALDKQMFAWLDELQRSYIVVLTKLDKVSALAAEERRKEVTQLVQP